MRMDFRVSTENSVVGYSLSGQTWYRIEYAYEQIITSSKIHSKSVTTVLYIFSNSMNKFICKDCPEIILTN